MKHLNIQRFYSIFLALPILSGGPVFASDVQTLVEIRNDRDSNVSHLSADLNAEDQIEGITFDTLHQGDALNGQETSRTFTLDQLEEPNGVVLDTEDGHNAILLKGKMDPATDEGNFVVSYLQNGFLNTYKSCPIRIARGTDGIWHLFNVYTDAPVSQIFVKTWLLGISNLQGVCE